MIVHIFNNKRDDVNLLFTPGGTTAENTVVIAGAFGVSEIALEDQPLTGASIVELYCSSPSGVGAYWQIFRDQTLVFAPDSTAYLNFSENGSTLSVGEPDDLRVSFVTGNPAASSNSSALLLKLKKHYDFPSNSEY